MRWAKILSPLYTFLITLSSTAAVNAQTEVQALRPGDSIERTIARGKMQAFRINLEREQLLRLVVEQHGIDVVVRVVSPEGRSLGTFDSPNGTEGPENVSLVTETAGLYRIDVLPLEQEENSTSGSYVIKVQEVRAASGTELEAIKSREKVKARGAALLTETAASLSVIRLPETRVRLQVQTSQLLWETDEKLARQLLDDATAGVKEYIDSVDTDDPNYYQSYQTAMQLRSEVVTALTPRNPELALSFLRATRVLTDPNAEGNGQPSQELQLEVSIASQIVAKDTKRALRVAQESLRRGYSYNLIDTLSRLQTTDPEAAVKLAGEIAAKLQTEDLLKNQEAASLLINFLQFIRSQAANNQARDSAAEKPKPSLLPEQEYRALFTKALNAALAYTPPPTNYYTPERDSAQNILNNFKTMSVEMEQYAPGRAEAVEKKTAEYQSPPDPQNQLRQKYQATIQGDSLDKAMEAVANAPEEIRLSLYQEIAQRAVAAGDFARAIQILNEHVQNPTRRGQAVKEVERQAIYQAVNSGKLEEALRYTANFSTPKERAMMLTMIVNRIGERQKKEAMLKLLDQARDLIGGGGRVEDQEKMGTMFEIARAYQRFEPRRGFEILDSLVSQFNEMNEAAVPLNGFGQQFFRDGELLQNGNVLRNIANQLSVVLGALSVSDFDRAKATADRLQRPEVRLVVYLAIARSAVEQRPNEWGRLLSSSEQRVIIHR